MIKTVIPEKNAVTQLGVSDAKNVIISKLLKLFRVLYPPFL